MLFQLRRADGRCDPHSTGSWVTADGKSQHVGPCQFSLKPGTVWTSPSSGGHYPIHWELTVPALGLTLFVKAVLPNQELHTERSTNVIYWEGAIDATGTRYGKRVRGQGYLEMTGYAGKPISEKFR
jgi:predicted secreted hydrolase